MVRTRGESTVLLVGTTNPEPLGRLPKLPTVRETLQRCLHLVREHNSVDAALTITTDELLDIWGRTTLPLRQKSNVKRALRKLHQELGLCRKNKTKETARKKKFAGKLDTLLDISRAKLEAVDERVMEFLEDQRGRRKFGLAVIDGAVTRQERSSVGESEADSGDRAAGDTRLIL